MAWFYLLLAGLFEIVWAVGFKYSQGFTRLIPSLWTLIAMGVSFFSLALAVKEIPIGTAYAVWTGIGAAGVALYGICFFSESASLLRLLCIAFILIGVLGLKYFSPH